MYMNRKIFFIVLLLVFVFLLACSFTATSPTQLPEVNDISTSIPTLAFSTDIPVENPTAIPTLTSSIDIVDVPTSTPAMPTQSLPSCSNAWFFSFDDQHKEFAVYCPEPVLLLSAVGQDFEGGRVYWYAPDPSYTLDQRGTIYVIYNDGEWVTFPDNWDASQPSNDPSLIPPPDRYQPVDRIGKVWRDVPDVRTRLGWAYGPPSAFQGRFQTFTPVSNLPVKYSHYYFIDHGAWNLVLMLNSVDMGPNQWEIAGAYK